MESLFMCESTELLSSEGSYSIRDHGKNSILTTVTRDRMSQTSSAMSQTSASTALPAERGGGERSGFRGSATPRGEQQKTMEKHKNLTPFF